MVGTKARLPQAEGHRHLSFSSRINIEGQEPAEPGGMENKRDMNRKLCVDPSAINPPLNLALGGTNFEDERSPWNHSSLKKIFFFLSF